VPMTTYAQRKALGDYGERVATRRLLDAGYDVLDRNWRCSDGEIDIVARDGGDLVVCEVKTRRSTAYGTPLEAVDQRKFARLHHLGLRWLADHPQRTQARLRVDVVTVLRPRGGGPAQVEHLVGLV